MSETNAQNIRSPLVLDDGRATFQLKAPKAQAVWVALNGERLAMTRMENGIWEATSQPLPPGIHDYTFNVDGTKMIDPSNRRVKKWFTLASMVEIPGDPPSLTEFLDVPHGVVHRVVYPSASVGIQRPVMVYTPPTYGAALEKNSPLPNGRFPIVVLMHGFGDDETAWTEVGRAHLIADNLIAQGLIQPVVIAMPFGHPVPLPAGSRPSDYFESNAELLRNDVMQDLIPFLEANFRISDDAEDRSVAGLSMGGGHALHIGLSHVDRFSSIGAFSAATPAGNSEKLQETYASLNGPDPSANELRHLYIPIGEEDFLLQRNEEFVRHLDGMGVHNNFEKSVGGHSWKVWRIYLPEFLKRVAGTD